MPELPEVQTIIDDLNRKIKGDTVVGFWSDWKKSVRMPVDKFEKEIKNKKIIKARRIGKNLFLDLSGGKTIYIHLKMTGHLLVKSKVKSQKLGKIIFLIRSINISIIFFILNPEKRWNFQICESSGK